jgi:hypothetical protein
MIDIGSNLKVTTLSIFSTMEVVAIPVAKKEEK